jgi:hypothetical protein
MESNQLALVKQRVHNFDLLDSNIANVAVAELVTSSRHAHRLQLDWDVDADRGFLAVKGDDRITVVKINNMSQMQELNQALTGYLIKREFNRMLGRTPNEYCNLCGEFLFGLWGTELMICPKCNYFNMR